MKGSNTRDNQSNYGYSNDYTKGNIGSNTTLIETTPDGLCAALNGYFSAKPYVTLPDGTLTLAWAKQAGYSAQAPGKTATAFVGAQLSGSADDETRNVRFVGGVAGDYSGVDEVGVQIIATYGNGQKKVFEGQTNTVYESIVANGEPVHAGDNGVDYFYTAVISGVPTALGEMTFEVFTYQLEDGVVSYSRSDVLPIDLGEFPEDYAREGWDLAVPAYEGGTLATAVYDAGTGLIQDNAENAAAANADRSYMMCVSNTTEAEFEAYEAKLVNYGYVLDSENTLKGVSSTENLYRQYRKSGKLVYVYFNEAKKESRVILDVSSVAETEFEYSFDANASAATEIYMYGMKYSTTGESTNDAPNNGAFYIIKQADGSLILIDGGGAKQSTDAAKAGLWSFLKEITGKGDTEKITIAAWIVTHAHEDHFKLAYDVMTANSAKVDLQRVIFNFSSAQLANSNADLGLYDFRGNIQNWFPGVKYLKCHTGQSIQLGSITVDVLMTHEDQVNATTGATLMESGNSMSSVMMFTLADGTTLLSLGDFEEVQQDLLFGNSKGYLSTEELNCDIVTVAHHGFNDVANTYAAAKAKYALWSNYSHENFPHGWLSSNKWRYERAEEMIDALDSAAGGSCNIYYAGKNTVKLTCKNGNVTVDTYAVVY